MKVINPGMPWEVNFHSHSHPILTGFPHVGIPIAFPFVLSIIKYYPICSTLTDTFRNLCKVETV